MRSARLVAVRSRSSGTTAAPQAAPARARSPTGAPRWRGGRARGSTGTPHAASSATLPAGTRATATSATASARSIRSMNGLDADDEAVDAGPTGSRPVAVRRAGGDEELEVVRRVEPVIAPATIRSSGQGPLASPEHEHGAPIALESRRLRGPSASLGGSVAGHRAIARGSECPCARRGLGSAAGRAVASKAVAAARAHRAVNRFTTPGTAFCSISTIGVRVAPGGEDRRCAREPPMLTTTSLPNARAAPRAEPRRPRARAPSRCAPRPASAPTPHGPARTRTRRRARAGFGPVVGADERARRARRCAAVRPRRARGRRGLPCRPPTSRPSPRGPPRGPASDGATGAPRRSP